MKKIVFAIQVFGYIALLPLYGAPEMNHVKKETVANRVSSSSPQKKGTAISTKSVSELAKTDNECMTIVVFKNF